jgi:threonine dehydrogenase-like Zn-dependent dehydrogenase
LLVRALLCFGRARLHSGFLRLGLLRGHVALRGGLVLYGGEIDPMPLMEMFDRGVQLRMGQAHVRRWIDDLLPIVSDDRDPLGVRQFATHHLPLEDAPHGYEIFRDKAEGCIKVVLQP